MLPLTPEQKSALASASAPVCFVDPETQQRYFLISQETYEKIASLLQVDDLEDSLFEFEDVPDQT